MIRRPVTFFAWVLVALIALAALSEFSARVRHWQIIDEQAAARGERP